MALRRRPAGVIYLRRTQQFCHTFTKLRQGAGYYHNLSPCWGSGLHLDWSNEVQRRLDAISAASWIMIMIFLLCFVWGGKEKIVWPDIKRKKIARTRRIARTLLKCGAISVLFWYISPAAAKVTTPSALRADLSAYIKTIWTVWIILYARSKTVSIWI